MNVIILGAGELGMLIASKLIAQNNNVVLIDQQHDVLENANDTLDVRVVEGQGTDANLLLSAGVDKADCFLALSGDESVNVLACSIAKHLGAAKTICSTGTSQFLCEKKGLTLDSFGIDNLISSVDESYNQIKGILPSSILQERIELPHPDARIDVINVPVNSVMLETPIKDLPFKDKLDKVRFAAIIRDQELCVPHGDTVLQPGDRVYVSGRKEDVAQFTYWLSKQDDAHVKRVVIGGASAVGERLITNLVENGFDVRVIEGNYKRAEQILANNTKNITILHGDMTRLEILAEADVPGCDAFAALSQKDENNILACLLASRLGAEKVIALTRKAEYMGILPDIQRAGCWFNMTQIAANAIFRMMSNETVRLDPILRAIDAKMEALPLSERSKYVGHTLAECKLPEDFLVAIVIRGDEVIAPTGSTVLEAGDVLIAIAKTRAILKMKRHI